MGLQEGRTGDAGGAPCTAGSRSSFAGCVWTAFWVCWVSFSGRGPSCVSWLSAAPSPYLSPLQPPHCCKELPSLSPPSAAHPTGRGSPLAPKIIIKRQKLCFLPQKQLLQSLPNPYLLSSGSLRTTCRAFWGRKRAKESKTHILLLQVGWEQQGPTPRQPQKGLTKPVGAGYWVFTVLEAERPGER